MNHLTTETIEKFIKGEYPYHDLLKISEHVLFCKSICLKKLDEIDPQFLIEARRKEAEREVIIKEGKHFTESEIKSYVRKKINLDERLKMNKHFIKCFICADALKAANPNYLANFLQDTLTKNQINENTSEKESNWVGFNILAPVAALVLLLVIGIVLVLINNNGGEVEKAKIERTASQTELINSEKSISFPEENRNINKTDSNPPNSERNSDKSVKTTQIEGKKINPEKPNQIRLKNEKTNKTGTQIAPSRSLEINCDQNPELAISPKNEVITDFQPTLNWKRVKDAVSYQINITDTKSNLIEEVKILDPAEITYKLKNQLNLNTNYKWKILVTLRNGEEIFGQAAQFRVGEKQKKPSKSNKSKTNEVRCNQNNK